MYTTLISVEQLQALQHSGQPLMVFDCSFDLVHPRQAKRCFWTPTSPVRCMPTSTPP